MFVLNGEVKQNQNRERIIMMERWRDKITAENSSPSGYWLCGLPRAPKTELTGGKDCGQSLIRKLRNESAGRNYKAAAKPFARVTAQFTSCRNKHIDKVCNSGWAITDSNTYGGLQNHQRRRGTPLVRRVVLRHRTL